MKNFAGFGDWIEIFAGGKQIDSDGIEHDGDWLIERAIEVFDPEYHEPPLTVGHPKDDSPAFGWVEGLKKTVKDGTNILVAKFKDIVPEFEQAVREGAYKKRSASFYPDGRLRHVGFLGAAPPAVKGLDGIAFGQEDKEITFEFVASDEKKYIKKQEEVPMSIFKEKIKNMLSFVGIDVSKIPEDALPDNIPSGMAAGTFSEADIEAIKKEAAEAERKKAETEFAEKKREEQKQKRGQEISNWVSAKVKEGNIPPALVDRGLVAFMQGLDAETEIQFSEGEKEKKDALTWMKDFMETLGTSPIFKEIATKTDAGQAAEFAEREKDKKLGESIAAKVSKS